MHALLLGLGLPHLRQHALAVGLTIVCIMCLFVEHADVYDCYSYHDYYLLVV